ncbi:hypothetical protein IT414_00580 [bacterium]|nr:hypothetical protein [bacterium]
MSQQNINQSDLGRAIDAHLELLKKDRERDVLIRRHGIKNIPAQTLEQIGADLGVTRERVRQIEKAALARIRSQKRPVDAITGRINETIAQNGGLMQLSLLQAALELDPALSPELYFFVKLQPELVLIEKNDNHDSIVLIESAIKPASVAEIHQAAIDTLKSLKKPTKLDKIIDAVPASIDPKALEQLLSASAKIANLEAHYGLSHWPEVNPKSIRDKIYFVLKKMGRPMHFSDIADYIQNLKTNPKKVTTQAVHNELIKDKRFILIGRGIYALAEWGYQAGTVADIIEEILREESPLSKDEIVRRVLARRQVKVTTIALNLQEKPQFERVSKATYRLRDAQ